jgi:hypothetical protein
MQAFNSYKAFCWRTNHDAFLPLDSDYNFIPMLCARLSLVLASPHSPALEQLCYSNLPLFQQQRAIGKLAHQTDAAIVLTSLSIDQLANFVH